MRHPSSSWPICPSSSQLAAARIFFYPRADTPGCTIQSCSVRDNLPKLGELKMAAVGISPDKPVAQKRFDKNHSLGFPLLSDANHDVAEAYGAWGERSLYGKDYMGIIRSSFLVDPEGKIVEAWYSVGASDTVPLAIAALETAKTNTAKTNTAKTNTAKTKAAKT